MLFVLIISYQFFLNFSIARDIAFWYDGFGSLKYEYKRGVVVYIQKIAVTGGPGGGKDGIIPYVRKRLVAEWGIPALGVPEIATEFFGSGAELGENGVTSSDFQKHVLFAQKEHETRWRELLLDIMRNVQKQRGVLLCNRGFIDNRVYIEPSEFINLMRHLGMNDTALRDEPYDGVVHCESAGVRVPGAYTRENNPWRSEKTPQEAAKRDACTKDVWIGHPHLWVVPGMEDFEKKKEKAYQVVCHILGLPKPYEIERKFLVEAPRFGEFAKRGIRVVPVPLEQVYLKSLKKITWRIRKRGQDGYFLYYETKKEKIADGIRTDPEVRIDAVRYQKIFHEEKDMSCDIIKKIRHYFLWENQYCELDEFLAPRRHKGLFMLEIELLDKDDPVILPPFLNVIREVTDNPAYTSRGLAKKR
ncbi:MAG: AAA family ATPase [bacterium]|nr:AAA family ATPase [bacterium]